MTQDVITKIAVLGGTGREGRGLALRWALAAYDVAIGSRQLERAQATAAELNQQVGRELIHAMTNYEAAAWADIVVLTVPYSAHAASLEAIKVVVQGKVFVDVTVPLYPGNARRVWQPAAGSATMEAQQILGPATKVVAAFQNVSAVNLNVAEGEIDCDVLVCGNDREAKQQVIQMARAAGMRAWDAGPVENAAVVEGLTSVLINLNINYKVKSAGLRITGIPH